jgi:hypothetical protein
VEYTANIKETIYNVDHDDAEGLFAGSEDTFQYTEKEASKVRSKLDLILLTIVRSDPVCRENRELTDGFRCP